MNLLHIEKRPFAFVIMPFSPDFEDVYEIIRTSLENDTGVDVARSDTSPFKSTLIYEQLIEAINRADAIVADLTGSNPNVFYELGLAHAKGKIVIPISADKSRKLPFDVSGFRTLFYDRKSLAKSLGPSLKSLVKEALRLVGSGAAPVVDSLSQSAREIIDVKAFALERARTANWNRKIGYFTQEHLTSTLSLSGPRIYTILDSLRGQNLVVCFNWKDNAVWMAAPSLEKDPDLQKAHSH